MSRIEKKCQRIENWRLVGVHSTDCLAPEHIQTVMIGEVVTGQERVPVQTSEVIWFSHTSGIAETLNTMYNLGEPDKEWIHWMTQRGWSLDHYAIEKM